VATMVDLDFSERSFPADQVLTGKFLNCSFARSDLDGATIHQATFENCTFDFASLDDTYISGTVFLRCSLRHCIIGASTMRDCTFNYCDLCGTDFTLTKVLLDNWCLNCESAPLMVGAIRNNRGKLTRLPSAISVITGRKKEAPKRKELPKCDHYRSAPSDNLNVHADAPIFYNYGAYYEEEPGTTKEEKEAYGYGENAVLECSDIEEYRTYVR
jgi:hypothetical protein